LAELASAVVVALERLLQAGKRRGAQKIRTLVFTSSRYRKEYGMVEKNRMSRVQLQVLVCLSKISTIKTFGVTF
jgi:hypothetical protein